MLTFLDPVFAQYAQKLATGSPNGDATYADLQARRALWRERIRQAGIRSGQVVSLEADFQPESIAALLELVQNANIILPIARDSAPYRSKFLDVAQVEWQIVFANQQAEIMATDVTADHALYRQLQAQGRPGLVLFTSGSTGESKGAVHDFAPLLQKFRQRRSCFRTLAFLQLDHIGGINTLFYTLSNGGAMIVPPQRTPASVCQAIESYGVELLPTSPTFLNLVLLSEATSRYDVSSLQRITYGTEPMPETTLARIAEVLPDVTLQQTYGMTEFGILRSKSRDDGSLWFKVGGEDFELKVVENVLWVRAKSAMLGYLNAPSPFDNEGFLNTGDLVEQDGPWIRILGRKTEVINVGGHKVYPAEVESVLLGIDGVEDAVVGGARHSLTGNTVTARMNLATGESLSDFKVRMRAHCRGQLPPYAVPTKISIVAHPLYSQRFKRSRNSS